MNKSLLIMTVILILAGGVSHSPAQSIEPNFLLGIDPLNLLMSPDVDGFSATDGSSVEEIDGTYSWFPTAKTGIGIDFPAAYLDFTVGVGYLLNDAFNATHYFGDLAFLVKVDEKGILAVGPHAGPVYFDPSWDGESDIELDSTTGLLGGIKFYAGGQRVKFSGAIDYLNAKLGVTGNNGWVSDRSELDISGFGVQLGVLFRF